MTERNCEITQVGDLLDEKGYGIAMKKGKLYQNNISIDLYVIIK